MSLKQARGTKRTCQNSECGSRFYDLNRHPIVCPVCESEYVIASAPVSASSSADRAVRKPRKPEFVANEPAPVEDAVVVDGDEALAEAGAEAEEPVAAVADETFLEEEEEDGGDVSNILGGPVAAGDEER